MTAPALVIQGSLVDAKNVSTHKCVRLSIDVPAELGAQIVKTFGWPTMAEPVAVAVARLNGAATVETKEPEAPKERQKFSRLRPSAQAALLCEKPAFRLFIKEQFVGGEIDDDEAAAAFVRTYCNVPSRRDLDREPSAAQLWFGLRDKFDAWSAAS